jgi:predicted SAM-dependent methyltransferase
MEKITLNLGCGERTFKEYPDGYKCINLDNRSIENVDVVGDVKKLSFPDNHFDYILASDIIEHFTIKETKDILSEWRRVLKPNGVLEIRTPNMKFLAEAYVRGMYDQAHPHPADFFSYHVFGGQDYPGNFHYALFDRSWLSFICKGCGLNEFEYEEVNQNFIMKVMKKSNNVIMRVAWNRPEMLQVSIEHEIKAREHYMINGDFLTIFVVDHNPPKETLEVINKYPYKKKVLVREKQFGLTRNILLGMKTAFYFANDYVIYIEDDICVHKTYFEYMDTFLMNTDLGTEYSVLSAYNNNDDGEVNEVYKGHHYCAWGALITKKFFEEYIVKHIHADYYGTFSEEHRNFAVRDRYMNTLNETYRNHPKAKKYYKYLESNMHNEQAGMINRLVDVALMERGWHVIMPRVNRQQHIGFYGKNRPGAKGIPGSTFEERVVNLRKIIKDEKLMYEMTGSKQYKDYKIFDKRLNEWKGELYVK